MIPDCGLLLSGAKYRKCSLERQENLTFPHHNPLGGKELWILSTSQRPQEGNSAVECVISGCNSRGCLYVDILRAPKAGTYRSN